MKIDEMRELRGKRAEMVICNYNRNLYNSRYYSVNNVYKVVAMQKHKPNLIFGMK